MTVDLCLGDALTVLRSMPSESVHCIVTSPPYWGLRSYGTEPQMWANGAEPCQEHQWQAHEYYTEKTAAGRSSEAFSEAGEANIKRLKEGRWRKDDTCSRCGAWRGELGLEPTPELYVEHIVQIFREARRVLRDDGTLWLNIGDSYASGKGTCFNPGGGENSLGKEHKEIHPLDRGNKSTLAAVGLKPKDLVGIPWRVAFALQADGWYLRSDIIWAKPNPMPESVTDRPTKAHEYIFLLAKSQHYYYDADAVREDGAQNKWGKYSNPKYGEGSGGKMQSAKELTRDEYIERYKYRNRRTVWTVATAPYKGAHFATFPPKLIEPCILAGCPVGGTVLDPFGGSGTTGEVAARHGRNAILIDLKAEYIEMQRERIAQLQMVMPL